MLDSHWFTTGLTEICEWVGTSGFDVDTGSTKLKFTYSRYYVFVRVFKSCCYVVTKFGGLILVNDSVCNIEKLEVAKERSYIMYMYVVSIVEINVYDILVNA